MRCPPTTQKPDRRLAGSPEPTVSSPRGFAVAGSPASGRKVLPYRMRDNRKESKGDVLPQEVRQTRVDYMSVWKTAGNIARGRLRVDQRYQSTTGEQVCFSIAA